MFDLQKIQDHMRAEGIGTWLVYDFRGSNPVFWQLLLERRQTTRRVFLVIPATGVPRLIGSMVEPEALAGLGVDIILYASWVQMETLLRDAVAGHARVAMEYSPGGALPIMSWVDGGTLELVRSLGPEVVSSAEPEDVEGITGFDEGPTPPDYNAQLERRGIRLLPETLRDEGCRVLQLYVDLGGYVYNATRE